MSSSDFPYYLANKAVSPNTDLEVTNKFTGETAYRVALADADTIDKAIAATVKAAPAMAQMKPYHRQQILEHCVDRFTERADELAHHLCIEAGKPINDSKGEVSRLIDTFKVAAEESVRINGEVQNLEISSRADGYRGMYKRVPIGPCSFISPFNFPLNLTAHKVAPALATGCPFVLKPASRTPIGALIIGEILAETDLPEGAFSILPCSRDGADLFTTDERLKLLSFTGSPQVGWELKKNAGKKKVVLELGGNAACILDHDTDLSIAMDRLLFGAFYQSGQSCVGVQRIFVHSSRYDEVKTKLIEETKKLKSGDPQNEETFIGPMISEKEATRLDDWIQSASDAGAKVLCGGKRDGAMLEATLLEDVPKDHPLNLEEAFGPVAILEPFDDYKDCLAYINESDFGIHAGIFTKDIDKIMYAWDHMEVGGVIINDVPSFRVDNMPYGGVKDSGLGREGILFAIEDMTEIRNLVIKTW